MFQFTSKAKVLAITLFAIGLIGVVAGFLTTPSEVPHDAHATEHVADAHHGDEHHDAEHHLHQLQNRPWAALLVNSFFFFCIGLGSLFFLAVQYAANVGWSAGLKRIMEALSLWLIVPGVFILFIIVAGTMHWHHLYHWMVEGIDVKGHENYDAIIAGKTGYLNNTFFIIRALIYFAGWYLAARMLRKSSLAEDQYGGIEFYRRNIKTSAIFLVFFAVTSSMLAWDWIMSIDTHWFSTLFGWYTFAGMFVTALTVLNLLTLYLKNEGYLEWINDNHLHDLAKFMFAFSIFWTYLWFSQYMLIWYSNIPEEVTYYMQRYDEYKLPFLTMLAMNFIFPFLVLLPRESKRVVGIILMGAVVVLLGHWMDHFVMIMPGTVGENFGIGLSEISGFVMFAGLFIYVVFTNLAKAPLLQKNHPMLLESKYFHQ